MNILIGRGMFKSKWGWLQGVPLAAILISLACFAIGLDTEHTKSVFNYFHETAGVCIGFGLFLWGFRVLKKKWLLDNTPTSTVRSAAMGATELKGKAVKKYDLTSRLCRAVCVYFRFLIEREVKDSKGRTHWEIVDQGASTNYFYLEDETGKILIDPMGAEDVMDPDYRVTDRQNGRLMRYTEWYIKPGDSIFAFGTVRKFKDNIVDRKEKLTQKLRELKTNKEKLMQFDADRDGQLSVEEWDAAVKSAEEDLLGEELAHQPSIEDDIVMALGEAEKTFIISDKSENEISKKLLLTSAAFVIIGGIIVVGITVSLVARLGLLPGYLAVPWDTFYKD